MTTSKYLELTIEPHQIRQVVSSVLHAILFTRLTNNEGRLLVDTVNSTQSTYSYCKLQDEDVEKQVDLVVQQLCDNINRPEHIIIVTISGADKRDTANQGKSYGWMLMRPKAIDASECMTLEKWTITVKVTNVPLSRKDATLLTLSIQESLIYICSSKLHCENEAILGNILYKIELVNGTSESLAGMLKRMLAESNIPPLLG